MKKSLFNKKIFLDFFLNIVASGLPIVIIQFLILPRINHYSNGIYGLVVTYVSLFSTISGPFGVCLNNARLLKSKEYENGGDFNIYYLFLSVADAIILFVSFYIITPNFHIYDYVFVLIISLLKILRDYLVVFYRIKLNYVSILINNIFLSVGYILGYFVYRLTGVWESVYLVGYLLSCLHVIISVKPYKEKLIKTKSFKPTGYLVLILLAASFLGTLPNYIDKLMLYPLIGEKALAIYYASTIFGKIIAQLMSPISNVILSYVVKKNDVSIKRVIKYLLVVVLISAIGFAFCMIVSKPLLKILYPDKVKEAVPFIPIATLSAIIDLIFSVINPFVLKFKSRIWQIVINAMNLLIYISTTIILYKLFGIKGFYIGVLIANSVKVCFSIIILTNKKKLKYKNSL